MTAYSETGRQIGIIASFYIPGRVLQPNTLKRWNGSTWVPIFDHDSYVAVVGDFMTGPLMLRAGSPAVPLTSATLIGADNGGVEWGRVTFDSAATTLQVTGASKTVVLATNATTRFSVSDSVVTSTLPVVLPTLNPTDPLNYAAPKKYVDDAVAPLISTATAESNYINATGDTMTGTLQVSGALSMTGTAVLTLKSSDPSGSNIWEAVPLNYVTNQVATLNTAIGNKLSKLAPGDTMGGPLTITHATLQEKIAMRGTTNSFIAGYMFNPPVNRIGYLSFVEGSPGHTVRLAADPGNLVALYTNSLDQLVVKADGTIELRSATTVTSGGLTVNGPLSTTGDVDLGTGAPDLTSVHGDCHILGNGYVTGNFDLLTTPTNASHGARKDYVDARQSVVVTDNGTANTTNASTGAMITVASCAVPAQTRAGILIISGFMRVQKSIATDIYQMNITDVTVPATLGTNQTRNTSTTLEYMATTTYRTIPANTAKTINMEIQRATGTGTGSTILSQANNNLTVVYVPS